jgi:murein DD-endopeptidase MepM/ murein hydrolase activator NlpD
LTYSHKDGTIAEYLHFKKDGINVKIGEQIKEGQVIGLSGNTGYSERPHLHLTVFKPLTGEKRENYKIKFMTKQGNKVLLKENTTYTAK